MFEDTAAREGDVVLWLLFFKCHQARGGEEGVQVFLRALWFSPCGPCGQQWKNLVTRSRQERGRAEIVWPQVCASWPPGPLSYDLPEDAEGISLTPEAYLRRQKSPAEQRLLSSPKSQVRGREKVASRCWKRMGWR